MLIRPAIPCDGDTVADIYAAARATALPRMQWAHTEPEIRAWMIGTRLPAGHVWVAERDGGVVGFMDVAEGWLDQLYVRPDASRQGIGGSLLDQAKALHPAGLQLRCFQCNAPARAFYEAHGFTARRFTDDDNEEGEPDMLYAWP